MLTAAGLPLMAASPRSPPTSPAALAGAVWSPPGPGPGPGPPGEPSPARGRPRRGPPLARRTLGIPDVVGRPPSLLVHRAAPTRPAPPDRLVPPRSRQQPEWPPASPRPAVGPSGRRFEPRPPASFLPLDPVRGQHGGEQDRRGERPPMPVPRLPPPDGPLVRHGDPRLPPRRILDPTDRSRPAPHSRCARGRIPGPPAAARSGRKPRDGMAAPRASTVVVDNATGPLASTFPTLGLEPNASHGPIARRPTLDPGRSGLLL